MKNRKVTKVVALAMCATMLLAGCGSSSSSATSGSESTAAGADL